LIAVCAIAVAAIAWLRTTRNTRTLRIVEILAGSVGFVKAASCYVALVIQPTARPAVGLGTTIVGLATMIAASVWSLGSKRSSQHDVRPIAGSRLAAGALVCLALGMLSHVPPDDPPRNGVGGGDRIGEYVIRYELDASGIILVVVMELPKDLSGSGGSGNHGRYTATYSFRSREPVTFEWTHDDAGVGTAKYDLSLGRVLCLVADKDRVGSLQLPLQPHALNVRSRFRWTHHGVKDEVRRLVGEATVATAMTRLRRG
jgi:hypothetical protein